MIEINLLPEELRKKESVFTKIDFSKFTLQKLPVLAIAAGCAVVLVLAQVLVLGLNIYAKVTLASLNKRYSAIEPKKKEADALKAQADSITRKVKAIDDLMGRRFSWTKKLNALSDSMVPGIWLTELDYDERPVDKTDAVRAQKRAGVSMTGGLVINGYAAGMGDQGAVLVGKFIKSLKDNPEFYSDFNEIELVAVKSDKVQNQEVMSFKISCFFK